MTTSTATAFPNLHQLFAELHARSCAIANRERAPSKAWPYWCDCYELHCFEKCIPPNDPDSAQDFIESWTPGMTEVGICADCGQSCAAKIEHHTELEAYGNALASRHVADYLGSECCEATILDAAGSEIDWRIL